MLYFAFKFVSQAVLLINRMYKNVTFVTKDVVIVLSVLAALNTLSLIALAAVLTAYVKVRNKPGNFVTIF